MIPSIRELNYFYEVAMAESFSRAALKLNISQPSLSTAVKKLEYIVGTSLFIRHNNGVTLTQSGERLFKEVKKLTTSWHNTLKVLQSSQHEIQGCINLGCHSAMTPFLSDLFSNLISSYPHIEIHIEHALTPHIMQKLVSGELDIGIVFNPQAHADIVLSKVTDIDFTLWVAEDQNPEVDFAEDVTIICDLQLPQSQSLLRDLRTRYNKNFRLSTTTQLESVAMMTAAGCGVGILTSCFIKALYEGKLKPVHNAPRITNTMYLAQHYQKKGIASIETVWQALKTCGS